METKSKCGRRSAVLKNNNYHFENTKQFFENLSIEAIKTSMISKVSPEDVFFGSKSPSHPDLQSH